MSRRLPPSFLRTTLYTNELFGNIEVQGNIRSGSIAANVIYGNVSGVNIVAQNIYGNLTANSWTPGNVTNLNITGNMTAGYFIGNGSQLTGIAQYVLPGSANIDISGNVIGNYANVTTLIGTTGNVANVLMVGGNVAVSGQINTLGNVVAPFFVGNGSRLTGIAAALPGVIAEDIVGNIIGTYANVSSIIATTGNVGNVIFAGGNVTGSNISGQSVFANLITFGVNANVGKLTGSYCVAMNGNDSTADGSDVKPFLTIQAAHDRALTEYPPSASGAIEKQVEIRVAPGVYTSPVTITRYNTVIRGAGSLFGRGTYTSVGQVTVNCANAAYLFNNTVGLDRLFCLNGVTNTGNGIYTLNIDSCYLTASNATPLTSENDKSYVYVNDTILSASLAGGNTYVRATGNLLTFYDCTIQAPSGVSGGGQFINVGGNCAITFERCSINALTSTNAIIKATSSIPSAASGFKINVTNSLFQNIGGPGLDLGTTNTAASFIRTVNAISPSSNLFAGNGTVYENELIVLPGTSNSRVSTVTVVPYATFSSYVLPGNASLDIRGNVIGNYANVTTLIGTTGNVGNVRMVGGNVAVSGQINVLGNAVASFFVGNGSQLTGIAAALPGIISEDIRGNVIGAYANVSNVIAEMATISFAGNANVLTVSGTTTNTNGASLIQATTLRGNNNLYSLMRLDNVGGRLLDVNGNGEMYLSSPSVSDILSVTSRTSAFVGNSLAIVVPKLSFTDYNFITCRNSNGTLFSVDGRGMVTAQCAVNGNVLNVVSSSATNTNDMIRIQSSTSGAQFNLISGKNSDGNVFRVNGSGAVFGAGSFHNHGADYAEMFEWEDGNASDEDRRGKTVVKGNSGFIRVATGEDNSSTIFGVVSTNPSIVGDSKWNEWSGRYLRDKFGSKLSNAVYYIANVSNTEERVRCGPDESAPSGYEKIVSSEFILNPDYDPNVAYVSREDRKEWATIGLVGKLLVLPDQVVNPNWILFRTITHADGDVLEYIVK